MYKLRIMLLSVAVFIASPASAQSYFPNIMVSDFPDPVVGKEDDDGGYADDRSARASEVPKRSVATQKLDARFTISQARRKANVMRFLANMKRQDARNGGAMEQVLVTGDPMATLERAMQSSGLSPANLGDVFALWWISSWKVVNGDFTLEPSAEEIAGVRNQSAVMMANWPNLSLMTNEHKQDTADELMLSTLLVVSAAQAAKANPAQARTFQDYVRSGAQVYGMDLDAIELTNNGFVSR